MQRPALRKAVRLQRAPSPRQQRGNGVLFALLGLAITGIVMGATIEQRRIDQKRVAGEAEATVLENIRNATNTAIFENYTEIQNGNAFTKAGVTINPTVVAGETVWRPTIGELRDMGYLPPGWSTVASMVNDGAYTIEFRRMPVGCAGAACNIEGNVLINAPVRADNQPGTVDGALVGPILSRIGADSGVSLTSAPGTIAGFGGTWALPNPVAGQPPGVIGVRVGTGSSGFAQFVRIGDARDPNLQGNLTVAGNTVLNGTLQVAQATTLNNTLNVAGGTTLGNDLTVAGTATHNGVTNLNGVTNFNANAQVSAGSQTAYAGAVNDCVTIAGTGIRLNCDAAGNASAGSGQLNANGIQFTNGGSSVNIDAATGSFTTSGNITSGANVSAQRFVTLNVVSEGVACNAGEIAQLNTGGIAVCQGGSFRAPSRFATSGAACPREGTVATETTSGVGLVCKGGEWRESASLMSPFQLRASYMVADGSTVSKPSCGNAGTSVGQPLIFLNGRNDTSSDAAYNRYAIDNGATWTVALRDGDNNTMVGALSIAKIYCYFAGV